MDELEISSESFERLVREALLHLYDAVFLQKHPLSQLVASPAGQAPTVRGKLLLQDLLDAIEALRPAAGTSSDARAWRRHRTRKRKERSGRSACATKL